VSSTFAPGRSVHIMGVGGAGMSALARVLLQHGCVVSGCDAGDSATLDALASEGVRIFVGHDAQHIDNVDVVTASPAIARDSAELVAATERQLTILTRAQVMSELGQLAAVVGVAGTHGKTTTSSMLVHIWAAAGHDPSWLLGADVLGIGTNGHYREGADLIVEVDESYGTFALLAPAALAITNVDPDHLDFYGTEATLQMAFVHLVQRTSGPVVIWSDQSGARDVADSVSRSFSRVSRSRDAQYVVSDEVLRRDGSTFSLTGPGARCAIELRVPGALNVINAAVAASLALSCEIEPSSIERGLAQFSGVARRFESRGSVRGTAVIDDYAHLPAEVSATIATARSAGYEKIVALFQPHRITRTTALADSFAGAFDGVSELFVTNIYSAGEANPQGVSGELIATAVRATSTFTVHYVDTLDEAARGLAARLGACDAILILGAGDVHRVIDSLFDVGAP
jgi:UDP-N-acetylmuramate--alanine ligase